MKKGKKILITAITGIILLIAIVAGVNFYPMLSMKPSETGPVAGTDVTAIRNNKNALYMIKSGTGWLVIDAGTDLAKVEQSLAEQGINPEEVTNLFLTHTDYDHVGSLPLYQNAHIYMGEDEKIMLDRSVKRNLFQYNELPEGTVTDAITYLSDGETVKLEGITIQCLKTPGHTIGSMSYIVDDKYFFTGDAFSIKGDKMTTHPYTMDQQAAQESIAKIAAAKTDKMLIFTAHYGYVEASALSE